jgi:membrane-bound lytic murein transglycosylase B
MVYIRTLANIFTILFLVLLPGITSADTNLAERKDVQDFIQLMVKKYKFNKSELVTLFNAVKLRPQVIQHINAPLEKNPWHTYEMLFVNEWRIEHGLQFWKKHADALARAEKTYGVPASIIVATIGIETKYGQKTGEYRVMDSLSSLGFSDSKRAKFFRSELVEFLLLSREQHINPLKIYGSYAGAIGQPQFMPSSYRHYAVNFSNSGTIDLMNNEVDVIGSIANYYSKHGWKVGQPVAVQALAIGSGFDYLLKKDKIKQPLSLTELARLGIVPKRKVDDKAMTVKVLELERRYKKEYWLSYRNFDVIKRYNSSDMYAMAVFQLSNYIEALRNRLNHG